LEKAVGFLQGILCKARKLTHVACSTRSVDAAIARRSARAQPQRSAKPPSNCGERSSTRSARTKSPVGAFPRMCVSRHSDRIDTGAIFEFFAPLSTVDLMIFQAPSSKLQAPSCGIWFLSAHWVAARME
jgi:hypothetical protein